MDELAFRWDSNTLEIPGRGSRILKTTEDYMVIFNGCDREVRWKDPSLELMGKFIHDFHAREDFGELYEAVREIRSGELMQYHDYDDWYDFVISREGIRIASGPEARYAQIDFCSHNSLDELQEALDVYCDELGLDFKIPDEKVVAAIHEMARECGFSAIQNVGCIT